MSGLPLPSAPRRVLAIIVTRIGDSLLCTPALRALKQHWPDASLTVWAHPKRMAVLDHLLFVDCLQPLNAVRKLLVSLRLSANFDLALVFSDDPALIALARRTAREVVAFSGKALPAARLLLVDQPGEAHAVAARMSLLESLGIASDAMALAYQVTEQEREWALAWCAGKGRPLVALQLHSFPTKAHRDWPFEHFVRFIEQLCAAYPEAGLVVTGDGLAKSSGLRLAERFGSRVHCVAGDFDLRQTGALLSCVDLYVGVDTGPTHLAGAVGAPMVALYHAAYPGRNLAPLQHPQCVVIEHPNTGAPDALTASMADVSPKAVWCAARALLERKFS